MANTSKRSTIDIADRHLIRIKNFISGSSLSKRQVVDLALDEGLEKAEKILIPLKGKLKTG